MTHKNFYCLFLIVSITTIPPFHYAPVSCDTKRVTSGKFITFDVTIGALRAVCCYNLMLILMFCCLSLLRIVTETLEIWCTACGTVRHVKLNENYYFDASFPRLLSFLGQESLLIFIIFMFLFCDNENNRRVRMIDVNAKDRLLELILDLKQWKFLKNYCIKLWSCLFEWLEIDDFLEPRQISLGRKFSFQIPTNLFMNHDIILSNFKRFKVLPK